MSKNFITFETVSETVKRLIVWGGIDEQRYIEAIVEGTDTQLGAWLKDEGSEYSNALVEVK